ncbi:MAG TPA: serine hydrolase, partial [bacterium]|nr:serine hydrolase [bacterium]
MQYLFFFLSPLLLFSHALCQSSQAGEIPLVFPGEEWQTLDPAAAGLDAEKLDALRDLVGGRGCVVRYGYMVYAWGDPAFSEEVASAFKPVLSTLLCFALQEGKLASPDEPVAKWEPRLKEINQGKDAAITWRHLASQTAAYGWAEPPGTAWAYNDFALALYYDTLMDKVFQQPGTEVLTQYIAQPLQFQDSYTFDAFGPQNRPGRLALSVRDFARYGLWILNRGHWRGQQILEKKYIDLMLHNPVPVDMPPVSGREADMLPGQRSIGGGKNITPIGPGFYSFNWWLN